MCYIEWLNFSWIILTSIFILVIYVKIFLVFGLSQMSVCYISLNRLQDDKVILSCKQTTTYTYTGSLIFIFFKIIGWLKCKSYKSKVFFAFIPSSSLFSSSLFSFQLRPNLSLHIHSFNTLTLHLTPWFVCVLVCDFFIDQT